MQFIRIYDIIIFVAESNKNKCGCSSMVEHQPSKLETPGSCPRCGKKVLAKKSKTGRTYYGCEDNPACGFMTWDIPLEEKCPRCGSSLFKTTGRMKMIHCLKEGCGYEKSAK